jgi:tRNA A58 N-methylase Trm61
MSAKSTMPLDQNEPLYIIELGTGSGKFSFFMLKVRYSANRVITTAACMRSCC